MRRPDAVIDHEDVDLFEDCEGVNDEVPPILNGVEVLLNGSAEFFPATLFHERAGLLCGGAIAEDDAGSGPAEKADSRGSNAARAAGDEGDLACEREGEARCAQTLCHRPEATGLRRVAATAALPAVAVAAQERALRQ